MPLTTTGLSAHCDGLAILIAKHFHEVQLLCKALGVPEDPEVEMFGEFNAQGQVSYVDDVTHYVMRDVQDGYDVRHQDEDTIPIL